MTINDAVEQIREKLADRSSNFSVELDSAFQDDQAIGNWLISQACGDSNRTYNTGDILWYHLTDINISSNGKTLSFNIGYYDTDSEDAEAIATADSYANAWGISSMTQSEAIKTIYLNLARMCTYDSSSRIGNNRQRNSLYDVFVEHKAVCQGYSNAMYYLINKYVTDCRIVQGYELYDLALFHHAWNLAKIDGYWYQIDLTAAVHVHDEDANASDSDLLKWCLKTGRDLNNGGRTLYLPLPNYLRSAWYSKYPAASTSIAF